jgi:competence protein ComFC
MTLAGLRQRPAFLLYRFLWNALDWVFPPHCAGCGELGERWCTTCRQSLTLLIPPLCSRCGVPLPGNISADLCQECGAVTPCYTSSRSVCAYTGAARKAVHRLKYGREIGIGEALSIHMLQLLNTLSWSIDMVTCVPLSKARMQQRGYNQSALLARPIALGLRVPFQPLLLRKTREVPSQVGLSSQDRRRNVEDAFESGRLLHSSSRILVIDDVFTTGSTMNACARALFDAGAQQIYGLTFARAGLSDHNQPI